jgi:NTP pyrophosphatase (non-canonical NTP hydrolase)
MKITKTRLKQIIKEELNDELIMVKGYGQLLKSQVKRKLAEMLREAAEDALEGKYPHLDGGVIQALHKALKESNSE